MASAKIQFPDEFLLKISRLGSKTDEIIPQVLEAGGEVALKKVRSNLRSVIGKDTKFKSRSTGELVRSLGLTKARMDRKGNWDLKIGFAEPRRGSGESNAKIANIIENGRHNQPAKPFLKPAQSASKKVALAAMESKLTEEINNL
jgi:hypothetical protein